MLAFGCAEVSADRFLLNYYNTTDEMWRAANDKAHDVPMLVFYDGFHTDAN